MQQHVEPLSLHFLGALKTRSARLFSEHVQVSFKTENESYTNNQQHFDRKKSLLQMCKKEKKKKLFSGIIIFLWGFSFNQDIIQNNKTLKCQKICHYIQQEWQKYCVNFKKTFAKIVCGL